MPKWLKITLLLMSFVSGVSWQPMKMSLYGRCVYVNMPGEGRAKVCDGEIMVYSEHKGLRYQMNYFGLNALDKHTTQDQFLLALRKEFQGVDIEIYSIEPCNQGVRFAAELIYRGQRTVVQRVYETKYAIYLLGGLEQDITRTFFESFVAN